MSAWISKFCCVALVKNIKNVFACFYENID
jgi:hypothetical protein